MRIKFNLILLFLLLGNLSHAQRVLSRQDYIERYAPFAVQEMYRSGVPASITLAQGCLESGNGNSTLSQKSNNHFGIKCHGWSGKGVRYNDDAPNECFRKYDSVGDSYADHSDFLSNNQRYASLFQLKITDYKGWARGLKKAGYATDPRYADKVIKIVEDNALYKYDKMSPYDFEGLNTPSNTNTSSTNSSSASRSNSNAQTDRVYSNGCSTIRVKAGDTMQKIADRSGLKVWEVYSYNDFPENYMIKVGEVIYLERKKSKASKAHKYHRVRAGDSMHSIAQKYGIKLKNLYKLNRMDGTETLKVGQRLNLRKRVRK